MTEGKTPYRCPHCDNYSCPQCQERVKRLRAASPVSEVVTEPVAWISFADNGNVRLWTMDQARAEREIGSGVKMTPLYAHPPSNNQELIEALRSIKAICIDDSSDGSARERSLDIAVAALSTLSGGNTQS